MRRPTIGDVRTEVAVMWERLTSDDHYYRCPNEIPLAIPDEAITYDFDIFHGLRASEHLEDSMGKLVHADITDLDKAVRTMTRDVMLNVLPHAKKLACVNVLCEQRGYCENNWCAASRTVSMLLAMMWANTGFVRRSRHTW